MSSNKDLKEFTKIMESYAGLEGISEFEQMMNKLVDGEELPLSKTKKEAPRLNYEDLFEKPVVKEEPEPDEEKDLLLELREEAEELNDPIKQIVDRIHVEQQTVRDKQEIVEQDLNIDIEKRIEILEKNITMMTRRSNDFTGIAGSGEVRLLRLDDVDDTNLADNKYLKYNSSVGKFQLTDGTAGGSKHVIQKNDLEDGTDSTTSLSAKTNLLFDSNTFRVSNDAGSDSTQIRLGTEFTGVTNGTALANKVLILGGSRAIDNIGAMTSVTSFSGGAITSSALITGNKINVAASTAESIKTAGGITMSGAIAGLTGSLTGLTNVTGSGTLTGNKLTSTGTGAASIETAGGITLSGIITGVSTLNAHDIDIQDTNAEAVAILHRNETGSNGNDLGKLKFKGQNSADEETNFAQIGGIQKTITNGSEDGEIEFNVQNGGTLQTSMRLDEDGIDIPGSRTIKFGGADAFRIMTTQNSSSVATSSSDSTGRIKIEIDGDEYYIPIFNV